MLEGRTATPLVQLVPIDAAMGVYCGFATVQVQGAEADNPYCFASFFGTSASRIGSPLVGGRQGREYRIKVHIGPPATLELEPSLLEILRPVLDAVNQRLKQAPSNADHASSAPSSRHRPQAASYLPTSHPHPQTHTHTYMHGRSTPTLHLLIGT